jgi:hypothetical protein
MPLGSKKTILVEDIPEVVSCYYLWGIYRIILWSILPLGCRSMGKSFAMRKRKKTTVTVSEDISASSCV